MATPLARSLWPRSVLGSGLAHLAEAACGRPPGAFDKHLRARRSQPSVAHARRRQCEDFFQHFFTEHVDKSIYWDQLRRLAGVFPREHIFVASLERFVADGTGVFRKLLRFLELPETGPHGFASEDAMRAVLAQRYNANGAKAPIADASLRRLGRFFAPHNRKLDAWLAATATPANTAFELWGDW